MKLLLNIESNKFFDITILLLNEQQRNTKEYAFILSTEMLGRMIFTQLPFSV